MAPFSRINLLVICAEPRLTGPTEWSVRNVSLEPAFALLALWAKREPVVPAVGTIPDASSRGTANVLGLPDHAGWGQHLIKNFVARTGRRV